MSQASRLAFWKKLRKQTESEIAPGPSSHNTPGLVIPAHGTTQQKTSRWPHQQGRVISGPTDSVADLPLLQRTLSTGTSKSSASNRARSKSPGAARDPLGLHVVYYPQNTPHRADIIFIHGLGGTSRSTWSKNRDPELFWPLMFLPKEPDICLARILSFGYNADILKGTKTSVTVLDFAKDLLFDLKYGKDDDKEELEIGKVPIIFIVHSMGGLLVKEAYMQGQNDPEYENIVKAVSAIIFLSTPHRGTNLAETLNRILSVSYISTPKQFITELAKNSLTLQKLNEQFRHIAPRLDIVSFYETQMTPIGLQKNKIMVLEKDTSVLGYPGEISKSLNADHHGVCKYTDPDDPSYVTVRNILKSLVSKVISTGSRRTNEQDELKELEALLAISEPQDVDYIFFRDRWAPGTCGWILQQSAFLNWMHDLGSQPRILWLHGNPASGKSILCTFLINHLVEEGMFCQYFFIRFGDYKKRSPSTLLRYLAYQLAESVPAFRKKLLQLVDEASKLRNSDARYVWQRIFRSILFKMKLDRPLYWVIDGLEESDTPRSLLRLLSDLASTTVPVPVRLLIVSRKTQELTTAFQKLSSELTVDVLPIEGNSQDIESLIEQDLDVAGDDRYKEAVKKRILQGASGNFLWVHLAVQSVNRCHTEADVHQVLEKLPAGMEALYDRMAQSITSHCRPQDKTLATTILSWITCSIRPLTLTELSQVLNKDIPQILDIQRSIGDLCGGFVVVDSGGNVAIVHKTAREYLVTNQPGRPFKIDRRAANEQLFLHCMQVLLQTGLRAKLGVNAGLRSKPSSNELPNMLEYAAASWFYHLQHSPPDSTKALLTLVRFLKGSWVLTWIQAIAHTGRLNVLISASTGLALYASKRQEQEASVLPLHRLIEERELVESWATDLVKIVGKFGSNLLVDPTAIYKMIPPFCPRESITYQQFGKKESMSLEIGGLSNTQWDDSLARLNFGPGAFATNIIAVGAWVAVLCPKAGNVIIYRASTWEEFRIINHGEWVMKMEFNTLGTLLATYGYRTTKVWDVSNASCVVVANNPPSKPRPHAIFFTDYDTILVGSADRRIRSIGLNEPSCKYEVITEINEEQLEGASANSPTCMALSSDGKLVALGYSGYPLSVWELEGPEFVGRCFRTHIKDLAMRSGATRAWGEVIRIIWHPFTGELLGLYLEGIVFKWHPYEDTNIELRAGASTLTVSNDGNFFATGDAVGNVKVFSTADFCLVYQLAGQDPVHDLTFSLDSHRFYDVRGQYANVWEPSALMRISEMTERSSNIASDDMSLAQRSGATPEKIYKRIHGATITALAAQPKGTLYCAGTEEGITELYRVGSGKVAVLDKTGISLNTEVIVWSECGQYVAFVDLSGKLLTKSIQALQDSKPPKSKAQMHFEIEIQIDVSEGPVKQIVFHPDSREILVYSTSRIFTLSLETKSVLFSQDLEVLGPGRGTLTWINHPSDAKVLLGFGPGMVYEWRWHGLKRGRTFRCPGHSPNQALSVETQKESPSELGSPASTAIGRVLVTKDKTQILVQYVQHIDGQSRKKKDYRMYNVTSFGSTSETPTTKKSSEPVIEIPSIQIPPEISNRIENPLSFISHDRLIFLDQNFWLCSWRLQLSQPPTTQPIQEIPVEVKRHYFLPGDWVSPTSVALCTVMEDGTLLCPRDGEVAVVKCSLL